MSYEHGTLPCVQEFSDEHFKLLQLHEVGFRDGNRSIAVQPAAIRNAIMWDNGAIIRIRFLTGSADDKETVGPFSINPVRMLIKSSPKRSRNTLSSGQNMPISHLSSLTQRTLTSASRFCPRVIALL